MTFRHTALHGAALLGTLPFAGPALAQGSPVTAPIDTVNGRSRPEYDAVGIPLGGFTILPELGVGVAYDNNIYRTRSGKRDDGYGEINPRITIASASERYPVSLDASATIRRYASVQTENTEQYVLDAAAAAEIVAGTRLSASGGYSHRIEPRGTAGDTFIGGEPIAYDLLRGSILAVHDVGAIGLEAGGDIARYSYDDAKAGGIVIDQRFRDYRSTGGHVRVSYVIGPAIAAFVRGGLTRSHYSRTGPIDRNSKGYSALIGMQFGVSNLISGSFGIGYLHENYADPASRNTSGFDYDVSLNWNPTPLIGVTLSGARSIQRSPFANSAGGIETRLGSRVDYELLRQIILSAELRHTRVTFRGVDRSDRNLEAQAGARYLVNRTVAATLTLNYRRQSSSGPGARNFDGFGAMIGVTLHR